MAKVGGGCPEGYDREGNKGPCHYVGFQGYGDETGISIFDPTDESYSELQKLHDYIGEENWATYGKYFEGYDPFQETMLRGQADIDKGQLGTSREFSEGQLTEGWTQELGQLEDDKTDLKSIWDIKEARLGDLRTEEEDIWGMEAAELLTRGKEASAAWGLRLADITRQETEAGEMWRMHREGLGAGIQSGMKQARMGQAQAQSRMGFATGMTGLEDVQTKLREQYGRDVGMGEARLSQTLGGLGFQRAAGGMELSQTLAGLGYGQTDTGELMATGACQLGIGGARSLAALSGIDYQKTLGKEEYLQSKADVQDKIDTGQLTYDQAVDLGIHKEIQGGIDIEQELGEDIFGAYQDWVGEQGGILSTLISSDAFTDDEGNLNLPGFGDPPSLGDDTGDGDDDPDPTKKVYGCTDQSANNYNQNATADDGSCNYEGQGVNCNENPDDPACQGGKFQCSNGRWVSHASECSALEQNDDDLGLICTDPSATNYGRKGACKYGGEDGTTNLLDAT